MNFARLAELGIPVDYASNWGIIGLAEEGQDFKGWHMEMIEDEHVAELYVLLSEQPKFFCSHGSLMTNLEVQLGLRPIWRPSR